LTCLYEAIPLPVLLSPKRPENLNSQRPWTGPGPVAGHVRKSLPPGTAILFATEVKLLEGSIAGGVGSLDRGLVYSSSLPRSCREATRSSAGRWHTGRRLLKLQEDKSLPSGLGAPPRKAKLHRPWNSLSGPA